MNTTRRHWSLTALVTTSLLLGLGWLLARTFGWSLARTSSPVTYRAFPEPARGTTAEESPRPRNIILVIADGLGFSHLSLAQHTAGTVPVWHRFAVRGWHDPRPIKGTITDSAASATALATGRLTRNGKVGVDENDLPLESVFELAWQEGYRTGIVTDSYVWDATPAAFAAHTSSRDNAEDILRQLASGQLDLLFGELEDVGEGAVPSWEETVDILEQRFTLLGADLRLPEGTALDRPLATIHPEESITDFDSTPNLADMVAVATNQLADTRDPFLLLIESEEIDSASHRRDGKRMAKGLETLSSVVEQVLDFAQHRDDTLVVFTSDHETGGLALGFDQASYPDVVPMWSSRDHTSAVVPLLAAGPGASGFGSVQRAWEVGVVLKSLIQPAPVPE